MEDKISVKNRSDSTVIYSIPEMGIRRQYAPGETKQVSKKEIESLTYLPGGPTLIQNCLIIYDEQFLKDESIRVEPEYWLDEKGIKKLLESGSLDEFKDCLDFAPEGVIDLVKRISVSLPLNDVAKREALKKKTGYDVTAIIYNLQKIKEEEEENKKKTEEEEKPHRRVATESAPVRRTVPQYKVVTPKKGE